MKLREVRIQNFRSIVDTGVIRIEPMQALVGENNSGKSNILKALEAFLTAGVGGVTEQCFFDKTQPMITSCTFVDLTQNERRSFRIYLLGDKLILEKHLILTSDDRTGKPKVGAEYHGYLSKPVDWWLSIDGVQDHEHSQRPNWERVAEENGILDYVRDTNGRVNKTSYENGLRRILLEREDIQYAKPTLGATQALGISQNLLTNLPSFYLLPAITDYADEIDKRSSSSVFRRLMLDLAERILVLDPRYRELETSLRKIKCLFNAPLQGETRNTDECRLATLTTVEQTLARNISNIMPAVKNVRLSVSMDTTGDFFSKGVGMQIDDGIFTDVLEKGHGLQRSVVFGLIHTLMMNEQGNMLGVTPTAEESRKSLILAIEEPELYIHPQMQRHIYGVLLSFSCQSQVMYSTHSPTFVDIGKYHCVAVVRKSSIATGTKAHQCDEGVLGSEQERKGFQLLNSFGVEQNEVFFARNSLLVEGEQDEIAIIAAARRAGLIRELPEEVGCSVIVAGNKENIIKFQKLLNAFGLPYTVLLELDGQSENTGTNKIILDTLSGNRCVTIPNRMENLAGHEGHFAKTYDAKVFFKDENNVNDELMRITRELIVQS